MRTLATISLFIFFSMTLACTIVHDSNKVQEGIKRHVLNK